MVFLDGLVVSRIMSFINPDIDSLLPLIKIFGPEHCPHEKIDILYNFDVNDYNIKTTNRSFVESTITVDHMKYTKMMSAKSWSLYYRDRSYKYYMYIIYNNGIKIEHCIASSNPYAVYYFNVIGPVIKANISSLRNDRRILVSIYCLARYAHLNGTEYFRDIYEPRKIRDQDQDQENHMFDSKGHYRFILLTREGELPDINRKYIMSNIDDDYQLVDQSFFALN